MQLRGIRAFGLSVMLLLASGAIMPGCQEEELTAWQREQLGLPREGNEITARRPGESETSPNVEAGAGWRRAAQERIERYRMAELTVEVVDAAGRPVADAPVRVQQTKRAFTFGSVAAYGITEPTADGQQMREIYTRLFNRVTCPIYWMDTGWPSHKDQYLAVARWAAKNHMTIRGHVMVYPAFRHMPTEIVALKNHPEQMQKRILEHVAEISEATREFGFREYDVTNELRNCVDVYRLLGREAVVQWFAEARRHLPQAKLAINEDGILTQGGDTERNQDIYLDWYRLLKKRGQAPDVMGFQGHFRGDFTPPERVYEILSRFAKETDAELQITEFDIDIADEQVQAAYMRDFMTICFSHPRVTGFTLWGIWENNHWRPRAALYRTDWSPKANAKVLEELLTKTWWTDTQVRTNAQGQAKVRVFLGEHAVSAQIDGKQVKGSVSLEHAGVGQTLRLTF